MWTVSMLAFGAIGAWTTAAVAAVLMALTTMLFAAGECLHGAIHAPLAADLAPPGLVGRYMAFSSQSWQIGWIVGPAAGGFILQHHPLALWPLVAGVNLAASAWALGLERALPSGVRRTPHVQPLPGLAAGSSG
jgi:MFS family permease